MSIKGVLGFIHSFLRSFYFRLRIAFHMVKSPVKLHLGCGYQRFEGYINIDMKSTNATDMICNVIKLPFSNNFVDVIENYHLIEHLGRHELPKALNNWFNILKSGGKMIIECPDFDKDISGYMQGNLKMLDSIFGLQRYPGDTHFFGYNFSRLKDLLSEIGFRSIIEKEPQDYHSKNEPCLRIECIK